MTEEEKFENSATTEQADTQAPYIEQLGFLAIRYFVVIVAVLVLGYFVQASTSISVKSEIALTFLGIFYFIPRFFYSRYKRVIINEEVKIDYYPRGIFQRIIYPLRTLLVPYMIYTISSLIIFDALVTSNHESLRMLVSAIIIYIAVNTTLRTPFFNNFFKAERIPKVYTFYRNWISIIITGFACFILAFLTINPIINYDESLRVIGSNMNTNLNNAYGVFLLLNQSLNIIVSFQHLALSFCVDTPYFMLAKAFLIALPYTVVCINVCLAFSLLTLPFATIKQTMQKQHWIKTNQNSIFRHWKTVCLPIFLIAFFGSCYHFGKPYYLKYQEKLAQENTKVVTANAEMIGTDYYTLGTIDKIKALKKSAKLEIQNQFTNAVNEINNLFADTTDSSKLFINWFEGRNSKYPFSPNDSQLKQAFISSLKIKALSVNITNIRKDLGLDTAKILIKLEEDISSLLSKSKLAATNKKDDYIFTSSLSEEQTQNLEVSGGNFVSLKETFKLKYSLPDIEKALTTEFNQSDSPWFNFVSDNTSSSGTTNDLERDLLLEDTSDDAPIVATEQDNHGKNYNKQSLTIHVENMINSVRENVITNLAKSLSISIDDLKLDNSYKNRMPTQQNESTDDEIEMTEENISELLKEN